MNNLAIQAEIKPELIESLTEVERSEFQKCCDVIAENIRIGNKATAKILDELENILRKKLWREDFSSEKEFIHSTLGIEVSSAHRKIKDRKTYLYLVSKAEDDEEVESLSYMNDFAFREIRRIATDNENVLQRSNETEEEYYERFEAKQLDDFEAIENLWKWIYPKVKFHRYESQKGILTNGGVKVTSGDILESSKVLQDLLHSPETAKIELENRDITISEIEEASAGASNEVINALATLAVSENLREKLQRQKQHIRDSLEKTYDYDEYEGVFEYKNGNLIIKTPYAEIDIIKQVSKLIGKQGKITIRTLVRDLIN